MTSIELGIEDLAKYPFLEETGKYIQKRGLSINDISEPDFNKVIFRAKKRVLEAIRSREVSGNISDPTVEILSFPVALMLVKATKLDHLANRYSHAEALRVERLLEGEREKLIVQIFNNILNIELASITAEKKSLSTFNYKIPVIDYLKRAARFHELEWKLINRVVDQGYVYLRTRELIRLIREEIGNMIREKLKDMVVPRLPEKLNKIVQEITKIIPPSKINGRARVTPDKYPPCVKASLNMLKNGNNLPHYGRFLLTTYLVNIGSSVQDILSFYPKSPDFNERITRYQIEHIAGLRGGRVKYICPSCRTLGTHSLCFRTKECADIKNPIQFGKRVPNLEKRKGKKGWMKRQR